MQEIVMALENLKDVMLFMTVVLSFGFSIIACAIIFK